MSSRFKIEPVTLEDIPALTELWYTAFSIKENLQMFPNTPGVRQWWNEANSAALEKPDMRMLKVIDMQSPDRIVAYAKWNLAAHKYGARYPPWHEDSDQELCAKLFGLTQEYRERVLGSQEHYCRSLLGCVEWRMNRLVGLTRTRFGSYHHAPGISPTRRGVAFGQVGMRFVRSEWCRRLFGCV